ncbi:hypothetical protein [Nitrosomonas aestuarii]|uniref:hypothetical protein n=1 Tax=Nitrosomonas aestuarii TaxID=52441 RepID=UPI000D30384A|nr:beta-ketoacyl synthase-like protein [Nitrosomonas aestuarii]
MIGHTNGASATIGGIATILSLQTGVIHPTINLYEANLECDLNYMFYYARKKMIQFGLCNAF